jgi:hypothetical protein
VTATEPSEEDHVLVVVLEKRSGALGALPMGRGTKEEMHRCAHLVPAIATGDPEVVGATLVVIPISEWIRAQQEQGDQNGDGVASGGLAQ